MKPDEKVFLAYFETKKKELYFNELKEITKLSDSSLSNTLKKLVTHDILLVNKTKSNTFYCIRNKRLFALKFSAFALSKFVSLNRGIQTPLHELLRLTQDSIQTIVLFGSASRKQEKRGSDIDLIVVTNEKTTFDRVKKEIDSISNYPLNIFLCSSKAFREQKDHLIIQAKTTGFPIKGEQFFYEVLLDEICRIF